MSTESKIVCNSKGPNLCHGIKTLTKADGEVLEFEEGKVVALCACGKSNNMPFCSGAHAKDKE